MKIFDDKIPKFIKVILLSLMNSGYEAYAVGGCIRDILSGISPDDWDLCTSATPEEIKLCLSEYQIVETGIAHGTVTVIKDGQTCEITTFRKEGTYNDHRHPDAVYFTSEISEDLSRRDFTVNAMAVTVNRSMIDLFGGREDLESKTIKCVGIAETRFKEDALRMLRALRFSACLEFKIEEKTKKAIFDCYNLIEFVAKERINNELKRLICGKYAYKVIEDFYMVFDKIFLFTDNSLNPQLLKKAPQNFPLRLALLLSDVSADMAADTLKNLKFDNATIKTVSFLLSLAETNFQFDKKGIRHLLSKNGREKTELFCEFIFIKHNYPLNEQNKIRTLVSTSPVINLSSLAINGYDIAKLGVSGGKETGLALKAALNAVVEEICKNEKTEIIKYLKEQSF